MLKIVFVRHGESVWNLENRFTGQGLAPSPASGRGACPHLSDNQYKIERARYA
jgi:bisphosphoglycerate-dependent phosphoglycerate mutase